MLPLSIIILAKNEEQNIARCLNSIKGIGQEMLVIDSGSTDRTVEIATSLGATMIQQAWKGYAETKNIGNDIAMHDWILSLDADEELNDELRTSIQELFSNAVKENTAYLLQRKMVYCGQVLDHGAVSKEFRLRLFNRQEAHWNQNDVHEDVVFTKPMKIIKLDGFLWHHSYNTPKEHRERLEKYAQLSALQMFKTKKKSTFFKLYLSPLFGFVKNYIFRAGFMDGRLGYQFAKNEMWYVKRKYLVLKKL
jgi:glycosyltransferase involved in cell wall biosynthesis